MAVLPSSCCRSGFDRVFPFSWWRKTSPFARYRNNKLYRWGFEAYRLTQEFCEKYSWYTESRYRYGEQFLRAFQTSIIAVHIIYAKLMVWLFLLYQTFWCLSIALSVYYIKLFSVFTLIEKRNCKSHWWQTFHLTHCWLGYKDTSELPSLYCSAGNGRAILTLGEMNQ